METNMTWTIYVNCIIFVLLLTQHAALGHNICKNSFPPAKPKSRPRFCFEYQQLSCCSYEQDNAISRKAKELLGFGSSNDCYSLIREMLCAECSPRSAHLYEGTQPEGLPVEIPILCTTFCLKLVEACPSVYQDLSKGASKEQVCSSLQYGSEANCFPALNYAEEEHVEHPEAVLDSFDSTPAGVPDCLCVEEFATGFHSPLLARPAFDGSQRIFVGEQRGVISIFYPNSTKVEEPFVDWTKSERLFIPRNDNDERGLLGYVFHPKFKENGRLFIHYSSTSKTAPQLAMYIRVSEFKVDEGNQNKLNDLSEIVLLEVHEPYANHNGGEMMFDTDGYLMLFFGDGGSQGDPNNNGQKTDTYLGKALRIDVDSKSREKPYGIPPDNPFIRNASFLPEIFAYGLRNTWRCGFDRGDRVTGEGRGRILCGDVGQDMLEEVDEIKSGGNYGWSSREGSRCYKDNCGKIGPEELPVFEYTHLEGKSVTGGVFYRGCRQTRLNGVYVFGDWDNGHLFGLKSDKESKTGWRGFKLPLCSSCPHPYASSFPKRIASFGEDEDGEIYVLTAAVTDVKLSNGKMFRIVDPQSVADCDKKTENDVS